MFQNPCGLVGVVFFSVLVRRASHGHVFLLENLHENLQVAQALLRDVYASALARVQWGQTARHKELMQQWRGEHETLRIQTPP